MVHKHVLSFVEKNGATLTKIWGHENIIAGANLGDLHGNNLRSILCEFTTSGTANADGTEVESLTYELRYGQPNNPTGEPTVIKNVLSLKFVDDESLVTEIDPRVRTMHATQTSADMDTRIGQLVANDEREEAIELVKEQIQLLKDVEKFDDERGIIALLIRMAENMHNKLKDQNCSCQYYSSRIVHIKHTCKDNIHVKKWHFID